MADAFVPATQPIEAVDTGLETSTEGYDEHEEDAHHETTAQPMGTADESNVPLASSSPAADDPFGESFATEAAVPNRTTSEIIEQNQNALKICSSDLEHVQPLHAPTPDEIIHVSSDESADANAPNASAPVGVNWLPTSTDEVNEPAAPEATDQTTAADEAATQMEPEAEIPVASEPDAVKSKPTRGFSIMPMTESTAPAAESQPVEQTASFSTPAGPTEPNSVNDETEVTAGTDPVSSDTSHKHQDNAISEDISRQADAILARLNKVNTPAAVEPEEQILADIQAQQREVTDSQLMSELEQQPSLPLPTPESHQDDSGMLVVNSDAGATEASDEPQTFPMTDSPISSGRASRMDYEQLFDRLRNLPEGGDKQ